jgi:hypothetical protein
MCKMLFIMEICRKKYMCDNLQGMRTSHVQAMCAS